MAVPRPRQRADRVTGRLRVLVTGAGGPAPIKRAIDPADIESVGHGLSVAPA